MRAAVLLALVLAACSPATGADGPRLKRDAEVVWRNSWKHFGGFSGFEFLNDEATEFVAITDRGRIGYGTLERVDGRIERAKMLDGRAGRGRLRGVNGEPLRSAEADAEGLTRDAEGRFYVSFEGVGRVRRYDRFNEAAIWLPGHPDFDGFQPNSGLEAIAIDAEDTLYAIPERSGAIERPFPVYRFRDGAWDQKLEIPRFDTFQVSDAAFGPDGRFYLLERDFTWIGGFSTRVRRFDLGPDGFDAGETLLQTRVGELDNMEAISVWRDGEGRVRVTLLSDDNFFALQRTIFVEYLLVED